MHIVNLLTNNSGRNTLTTSIFVNLLLTYA